MTYTKRTSTFQDLKPRLVGGKMLPVTIDEVVLYGKHLPAIEQGDATRRAFGIEYHTSERRASGVITQGRFFAPARQRSRGTVRICRALYERVRSEGPADNISLAFAGLFLYGMDLLQSDHQKWHIEVNREGSVKMSPNEGGRHSCQRKYKGVLHADTAAEFKIRLPHDLVGYGARNVDARSTAALIESVAAVGLSSLDVRDAGMLVRPDRAPIVGRKP